MSKENKYRIISKDGQYLIEKKFLFWWVLASIKCGYTLGHFGGNSSSDLMIHRCYFSFNSLSTAKEFMDKYLINPYKERYYGEMLIRIPWQSTRNEVYVCTSDVTEYYAKTPCYRSSSSLERLKSHYTPAPKFRKEVVYPNKK